MNTFKPVEKSLKNVVVAVEPVSERSTSFDIFSKTIKRFQESGLLPSTSITSIIHSALYMVPNSWYFENEDRYANEAKHNIDGICSGRFEYSFTHVLKGEASSNQFLVEQISEYLKRIQSSLLVVLSNNRTGLPYWILGSFAETAALTSTAPILVIKPQVKNIEFSAKPRLVIAVDASATYSPKYLKWISELALPAEASLDLVYVKPKPHSIFSSIRKPEHRNIANRELRKMEKALKNFGLATTLTMINEKGSVAQSIVDYADKKKAWSIITISAQRKLARRLLIGSTARRVLSLTKRPYISLRLN
jgi:nucleotide-binding universal stress UspA family protein